MHLEPDDVTPIAATGLSAAHSVPMLRPLWLDDQQDGVVVARPLDGCERTDVCVVGGGFTGLWTGLKLKERHPDLGVSLIDKGVCGAGASGRNGGFVMSWWLKLGLLSACCGSDDARWLCEQSERAVRAIGELCKDETFDADFSQCGWLWTATTPSQYGAWSKSVADARDAGRPDVFLPLGADELQERTGSRAVLAGVLDTTCATVHPGRLVRGLRRLALARGVRIYEHTPLRDVTATRDGVVVKTPLGRISASRIVLATGAWTPGLRPARTLRRHVIPVASDVIATAPVPGELSRLGWRDREVISDSRTMITYLQQTADGRVVIGKAGGTHAFAGRIGSKFEVPSRRIQLVKRSLQRLYPTLLEVPLTHAWSGPVDRTPAGIPYFGFIDRGRRIAYGVGFSGNGVGPSYLAGEILASLATETEDRWTSHALAAGFPPDRMPPEPIRFLGGKVVRAAVAHAERADDDGRVPSRLVTAVAAMAPSGATPKRKVSTPGSDGVEST